MLIVSAESNSQITNYEDRATCVLLGDGAAAAVVTASGKRFGSFIRGDGSGSPFIYARHERQPNPFLKEDAAV